PYTLYTSNTSLVMLSRISPTTALSILFCNDPATTDIYTLSLHDALPISSAAHPGAPALGELCHERVEAGGHSRLGEDGGANRAAIGDQVTDRAHVEGGTLGHPRNLGVPRFRVQLGDFDCRPGGRPNFHRALGGT